MGEEVVMRVFWHPYTNDAREAWVDVTGKTGAEILIDIANGDPDVGDIVRLEGAIRRRGPFNNPRHGCIRYDPK